MTPIKIRELVDKEADARFGETIERLLSILEYNARIQQAVRACYCDERSTHTTRLCENCREG